MLKNMITPEGVDEFLEEEIREECQKYGRVTDVSELLLHKFVFKLLFRSGCHCSGGGQRDCEDFCSFR
jgi:hypothetical protein